jgi:hypothetical protein
MMSTDGVDAQLDALRRVWSDVGGPHSERTWIEPAESEAEQRVCSIIPEIRL